MIIEKETFECYYNYITFVNNIIFHKTFITLQLLMTYKIVYL